MEAWFSKPCTAQISRRSLKEGKVDPRLLPGNPLVQLKWHRIYTRFWPQKYRQFALKHCTSWSKGFWIMNNKIKGAVPIGFRRKYFRGFKFMPRKPKVWVDDSDESTETETDSEPESAMALSRYSLTDLELLHHDSCDIVQIEPERDVAVALSRCSLADMPLLCPVSSGNDIFDRRLRPSEHRIDLDVGNDVDDLVDVDDVAVQVCVLPIDVDDDVDVDDVAAQVSVLTITSTDDVAVRPSVLPIFVDDAVDDDVVDLLSLL